MTITKYYSIAKATWIKLWFLFKSNIWNNVKYINHWLFSTISRIRNTWTRILQGNQKQFELSRSIAMLKLIVTDPFSSALQCMVQWKFIRNANMIRHFLYKKWMKIKICFKVAFFPVTWGHPSGVKRTWEIKENTKEKQGKDGKKILTRL